jgi:hypothetical protein
MQAIRKTEGRDLVILRGVLMGNYEVPGRQNPDFAAARPGSGGAEDQSSTKPCLMAKKTLAAQVGACNSELPRPTPSGPSVFRKADV